MEKRLYRSRTDRVIGGVCAGLADFFAIDVVIVRLVVLALFLAGTIGLWPYLILWIIVPEQP
jgi:phage shock protein C